VYGTSTNAVGVYGLSTNFNGLFGFSGKATGVGGTGGVYGGTFYGLQAAIRLTPQTTAGKPTSGSHLRGELLCDKDGVLWFCTAGGLNGGTWKKVTLS
jgi:hypothetical protein